MPICTSQGQISSGRAWIVTARVALNVGCLTTSSPDMARATSSSVAPHRSCQGRMKRRYAPAATPRAANDMTIFLNIKVPPLLTVLPSRLPLSPLIASRLQEPVHYLQDGRDTQHDQDPGPPADDGTDRQSQKEHKALEAYVHCLGFGAAEQAHQPANSQSSQEYR